MKIKKMFIFMIMTIVFTSCEADFEDMMNDANNADAALQSVTIQNASTSADIDFNFKRGVTSYTVNAGSGTDSVNISAVPVKAGCIIEYRVDGSTWSDMDGVKTVSGLTTVDSKKIDIQVTSVKGDGVVYSFNVSGKYIKLIYSANGATGGAVPVDAGNYVSGEEVTVSDNTGSLVRIPSPGTGEAFKFGGWNTKADGSGITYTASQTFEIAADTVLYVKWVKYELRDRGPANGWIFHDKGNYSDGWRYLELYPEGFQIHTSSAVAQAASYPPNDWYIPAKEEMRYMYDNLVLFDTKSGSLSTFYKFMAGSYGTSSKQSTTHYFFVEFYTVSLPNDPAYSDTFIGVGQFLPYRAIRKF